MYFPKTALYIIASSQMFHIGTATGEATPALLAERDNQRTRHSMTRNLKKGMEPKASKKSKKAPKKQKKGKKQYQPFTSKADLKGEVNTLNNDPSTYDATTYG